MGVALVAGYMLVLQALLGAFALGTAAAAPMLDVFGNPLCVTGDSLPGERDHTALPDCCVTACGMFAPATPDDSSARSLANPLAQAATTLPRPEPDACRAFALERGPGNPRAPPLTV